VAHGPARPVPAHAPMKWGVGTGPLAVTAFHIVPPAPDSATPGRMARRTVAFDPAAIVRAGGPMVLWP